MASICLGLNVLKPFCPFSCYWVQTYVNMIEITAYFTNTLLEKIKRYVLQMYTTQQRDV